MSKLLEGCWTRTRSAGRGRDGSTHTGSQLGWIVGFFLLILFIIIIYFLSSLCLFQEAAQWQGSKCDADGGGIQQQQLGTMMSN